MVTSVEGPAHAATALVEARRKMKGKEKVEDDPPPLMTSPVAHPNSEARRGRHVQVSVLRLQRALMRHKKEKHGVQALCRHRRTSRGTKRQMLSHFPMMNSATSAFCAAAVIYVMTWPPPSPPLTLSVTPNRPPRFLNSTTFLISTHSDHHFTSLHRLLSHSHHLLHSPQHPAATSTPSSPSTSQPALRHRLH